MYPENTNHTLRPEQFQSVDVIFSSFGTEPDTENKTIIVSEVSDSRALNGGSAFFNLEDFAQNLTVVNINSNYNCFKGAVASRSTKLVIAWTLHNSLHSYNNNAASWGFSGATYKMLSTDADSTFYD
ncbi:hypothetical protein BGX21_009938 [Mortierella sp. AD011]|nr:hypothetical protein BGX20_007105 [Mortierella sp. AD010]KAF9402495.1 hypothetical protein BGX21_009938 [Mortierella sp. AD011]